METVIQLTCLGAGTIHIMNVTENEMKYLKSKMWFEATWLLPYQHKLPTVHDMYITRLENNIYS